MSMYSYVGGQHLYPSARKKKKATPPKTFTPPGAGDDVPTQETFDPQAYAREQAQQWLQAQLDSINAQKTAYLADLQEQSDMEVRRGQAIAQALQQLGIPQQIQGIYGNASADIGGLANAFAGSLRDTATKNAAEETRMVSGSGQEGAVRNDAEGLGNVVYGVGGYIPARNMSEQGAAFASQAAMEPGFATRIGGVKAADVYSAGLEGLRDFTKAITDAQAQVPDVESKILESMKPDISYHTLANGQVQAFDDNTGRPIGAPTGPKKASKATAVKTVRLADGTYQAVNAKGQPIGKPFGPPKAPTESTASLKSIKSGNKVLLVDPHTGQVVKTFAAPDTKSGKKSSVPKQYTYNGTRYTFDAQGNIINRVPLGQPKTKLKYTPLQISKFTKTAYNIAKSAAQGYVDENGATHAPWSKMDDSSKRPKDVLQDILGEGVPFDIAVKQIAKFFKPAKGWLKDGTPAAEQTITTTAYETPQVPKADILPVSWTPTHVSDGLGWGTKSAVDLFPGPPGTPVGSPVSGTVVYFHPDGAQGGGSMLIRGDDGYEYWIGHIDAGAPAGTRLERGSQIAVVSSRHPTPHVHIDRKYMGNQA